MTVDVKWQLLHACSTAQPDDGKRHPVRSSLAGAIDGGREAVGDVGKLDAGECRSRQVLLVPAAEGIEGLGIECGVRLASSCP